MSSNRLIESIKIAVRNRPILLKALKPLTQILRQLRSGEIFKRITKSTDVMAPTVAGQPAHTTDFNGSGYIDQFDNGRIVGWCCDLNHLNASLALEVRSSGGQSIFALADLYRKDVHEANFGNGCHGFSIDISSLAVENDTITIYYLDDGSPLNKEPLDFDINRAILNGNIEPRFFSNITLAAIRIKQKYHRMLEDGLFIQ